MLALLKKNKHISHTASTWYNRDSNIELLISILYLSSVSKAMPENNLDVGGREWRSGFRREQNLREGKADNS